MFKDFKDGDSEVFDLLSCAHMCTHTHTTHFLEPILPKINFTFTFRGIFRAGEMAQRVKVLAATPDNLSSGHDHTVKGENSSQLFSDLCPCMNMYIHTHNN